MISDLFILIESLFPIQELSNSRILLALGSVHKILAKLHLAALAVRPQRGPLSWTARSGRGELYRLRHQLTRRRP